MLSIRHTQNFYQQIGWLWLCVDRIPVGRERERKGERYRLKQHNHDYRAQQNRLSGRSRFLSFEASIKAYRRHLQIRLVVSYINLPLKGSEILFLL